LAKLEYYWLLSDGKTVRQISHEEWFNMNRQNWNRKCNLNLICFMDSSFLQLRRGKNYVTVSLKQLKQLLNGDKVG